MTVHQLTISRVIAETPDARSIEFDVPADAAKEFTYRPGQFLTLRVPSDQTGSVARCYSLCSAPHDGGPLRVTVKRTVDGYASNWLCDNATAGMTVEVLAPAGIFTPKTLDNDLLLFAGGSGITPVMSILKTMLAKGDRKVTLVYANRDVESIIFATELAELSRQHPHRLVVLHWLEPVQGLPSVEQLTALAHPFADREVFICGPGPFMDAVTAALSTLGLDRKRVHVEKFKSLPRNPFDVEVDIVAEAEDAEEVAADLATNATAVTAPAALTVDLDGVQHKYVWPRQQKLLDFLLAQGLDAPYSCREGACSACACRIISGEVKMLHNEVLDSADLDDGIVLACQSIAITDEVSVTYE